MVATPTGDTAQTYALYLSILPALNSDGSARFDSGATANYTDSNGMIWLADDYGQQIGGFEGFASDIGQDYHQAWQKANNPDITLWETNTLATGGEEGAADLAFDPIILPNGTYDVRMLFAQGGNNNGGYTAWGSYQFGPVSLVTQNIIQAHSYDQSIADGHTYRYPASVDLPAIVTNRILTAGVYTDPTAFWDTNIQGLAVIPYTGAPKWTIDTQQQTSIALNGTLQVYVQDWAGVNDPVWSLSGGPGSISSTGLYTAPSILHMTQKVWITATSQSDPFITASVAITVLGTGFL